MATPTAAPARLSKARTPATPAARATPIVPDPDLAEGCDQAALEIDRRQDAQQLEQLHGRPRGRRREAQPDDERHSASTNEAPSARHDAHAGGDEGHEVGADGHGADDQDRVVDDHPVPGDDAGDEHEPQVAAHDPRLHAGCTEHISPHQHRCAGHLRSGWLDPVAPRQADVIRGDAEAFQGVHDLFRGLCVHLGHHVDRPIGRRRQYRRVADAVHRIQQTDRLATRLSRHVDVQVEHQPPTVGGASVEPDRVIACWLSLPTRAPSERSPPSPDRGTGRPRHRR